MSIELKEARKHSEHVFDANALTNVFYKSQVSRERIDELTTQIENEPLFRNRFRRIELSRENQFRYSFKVCAKLLELSFKHSWNLQELDTAMFHIIGEPLPTTLHNTAFKYVIEVVGSQEQKNYWLPKCNTHEVIGCYAQTELGHGSNVRFLQTKAIYNPSTKDLTLESNSPLTARKWWIGGLAITADHAVVQAILYMPNKQTGKLRNLGPHLFIVPIRDPKTRVPLEGVTVGDIGPKAANGFSIIDNGYLALDKVTIPVNYMLNRFTNIDTEKDEYVITGNPKVMYASMTNIRAAYPTSVGNPVAKAVTIATRYLTVRRQFLPSTNVHLKETTTLAKYSPEDHQELQVIKYSSVYMRLVPLIALSHSFGFINNSLSAGFEQMVSDLVGKGDDTLLPEIHSLTSSLKGVISILGTNAIEQCQILMGGHGFSYNSGIASLYGNTLPSQTFEGENFVVAQQTAQSLVKQLKIVYFEGKEASQTRLYPAARFLVSSIEYLKSNKKDKSPQSASEWEHAPDDYLVKLFERRTTALVADLMIALKSADLSDNTHLLAGTSFAFGEQYMVTEYLKGTRELDDTMIHKLAKVFTFKLIKDNIASFVEVGLIQPESIGPLNKALESIIRDIAPHAVALTDAFKFTDYELNTALGNYDGNPYEHLVDRARFSSLNNADFSGEIAALKRAGFTKPLTPSKL